MTDGLAQLNDALRTEPPSGIAALPDETLADLAGLVRDARRKQAEQLNAAFEATLKHVPFPVRGIVRKVLIG
jgi:hypothetical protein